MAAKGLTVRFLVLLFVVATTSLAAQTGKDSNKSDFRLILSVTKEPDNPHPAVLQLVVKMTNTSSHWIFESTCAAFGALYQVVATRDGEVIPEDESVRTHREEMEHAESIGYACDGSNPGRRLKPGESYDDDERLDVSRPGTYEVYVQRLSFKRDPSDCSKSTSTVVKSNTVTVVMPDPKSEEPIASAAIQQASMLSSDAQGIAGDPFENHD